ncbi:hypothetical protein F4680DRAFT_417717 [Xylaria scruposa]|nr:hypothetical protein F4680DRAFT_417717 [Xylaria scruposa]
MGFSIEAIVGIIALFVALPPAMVIFARVLRRYPSRRALQGESPGPSGSLLSISCCEVNMLFYRNSNSLRGGPLIHTAPKKRLIRYLGRIN